MPMARDFPNTNAVSKSALCATRHASPANSQNFSMTSVISGAFSTIDSVMPVSLVIS